MSEWKEHKLGDVITFQRGHDLPKTEMKDGVFPVAGSNGIIGYHNTCTTKGPGITIGRSGSIGTPLYYENDYWAHNTVLYVKDFKGNFPKFIFYFLKTLDFTQFNAGSAVPTLNRNHIHDLQVKIPTYVEQTAIATILSSLDDKIDLLHRQNKTLEQMAETLFRQWLVEEAEESWSIVKLGKLGKIVCGKTPSKKVPEYFNGKIPFIKIPDMHGKTYVFDTEDSLTELGVNSQSNKTIPPKSICVSCIATVGIVVMNAKTAQSNQQINSIVPSKDIYRYFLYLKMLSMKDELLAMASGGTATDNLNTGDFSNIDIVLPDELVLKKFDEELNPIFEKIFKNQTQIYTLTQLRDTLLPKLMSGEVRVKI